MPIDKLPNEDLDRDTFEYQSGTSNLFIPTDSFGEERVIGSEFEGPGEIRELFWEVSREDDGVGPLEISILADGDFTEWHVEKFIDGEQKTSGNLLIDYEMANEGDTPSVMFEIASDDSNDTTNAIISWQMVTLREASNTSAVFSLSDNEESFD